MAKKKVPAFTVDKADLKKMTRSEQRRFLDLGLVKGEAAAAGIAWPAFNAPQITPMRSSPAKSFGKRAATNPQFQRALTPTNAPI